MRGKEKKEEGKQGWSLRKDVYFFVEIKGKRKKEDYLQVSVLVFLQHTRRVHNDWMAGINLSFVLFSFYIFFPFILFPTVVFPIIIT